MSAAAASRRQRFVRQIRESHKLYGRLVTGFMVFYVVIDVLTGFLFSWVPGEHGPDVVQDNPLLAFLGLAIIPLAMVLTIVGTIWIYDHRRSLDDLNWIRRIWGAIFLFIGTFVALSFTPDGLGPVPLIGLLCCWLFGRYCHDK